MLMRTFCVLASSSAALALGACSAQGSDTSAGEADTSTGETSEQATAPGAPSSEASSAPASQASAGEKPADDVSSSAKTERCSANELKTTVEQGDSAAGHLGYTITFENTSDEACALDGHPGLSAVGNGDGSQIGASASRVGESPESVVLIPSAHATAAVEAVNIGDDGGPLGDSCDATAADGWRIYPPDSKTSVYVEQDGLKVCANKDADWLTVSAVQPVS